MLFARRHGLEEARASSLPPRGQAGETVALVLVVDGVQQSHHLGTDIDGRLFSMMSRLIDRVSAAASSGWDI